MPNAIVVVCALSVTSGAGRPQTQTAALPLFDQRSITRESTAALVGTVVDSASGSPIERAQMLLISGTASQPHYVFTDSWGGFILGHLKPREHSLIIRSLSYAFRVDSLTMRAGRVNTLRTQLRPVRNYVDVAATGTGRHLLPLSRRLTSSQSRRRFAFRHGRMLLT